jgi:hypothetical protein
LALLHMDTASFSDLDARRRSWEWQAQLEGKHCKQQQIV